MIDRLVSCKVVPSEFTLQCPVSRLSLCTDCRGHVQDEPMRCVQQRSTETCCKSALHQELQIHGGTADDGYRNIYRNTHGKQSCRQLVQAKNVFLQFVHVNSFLSIHSFQFLHVNAFMSMPSFQFHVNSLIPILSLRLMQFSFIRFNSFISIPSCQFLHVISFIHFFHVNSCISCIPFHVNSRLSNSPRIPISRVSFWKIPPRRVPGTTW